MLNDLPLNTLEDIKLLKESWSLECKLARGQDGKGKLPNDFWETYSAMANTYGGVVLLGDLCTSEVRGKNEIKFA